MFGIAWGVGSLLFLVGVGEGFRSGQHKNLANIGEDCHLYMVRPRCRPWIGQHQGMRRYYLTHQDYLDIKKEATLVKDVAPIINRGDIRAVSDFASASGSVTGKHGANYNQIRFLPQGKARWLNDGDEEQRRSVCVLVRLPDDWRNLFPGRPAIGSIHYF